VDVIMRGCLSISTDFARGFLRTTHGWHHPQDGDDVVVDDGGGGGGEGGGATTTTQTTTTTKTTTTTTKTTTTTTTSVGVTVVDAGPSPSDRRRTWVNDRRAPMYVRADSEYSLENGRVIDELIGEHHPRALLRRVDL
jgi:hypothetical protein